MNMRTNCWTDGWTSAYEFGRASKYRVNYGECKPKSFDPKCKANNEIVSTLSSFWMYVCIFNSIWFYDKDNLILNLWTTDTSTEIKEWIYANVPSLFVSMAYSCTRMSFRYAFTSSFHWDKMWVKLSPYIFSPFTQLLLLRSIKFAMMLIFHFISNIDFLVTS